MKFDLISELRGLGDSWPKNTTTKEIANRGADALQAATTRIAELEKHRETYRVQLRELVDEAAFKDNRIGALETKLARYENQPTIAYKVLANNKMCRGLFHEDQTEYFLEGDRQIELIAKPSEPL